jgi:hypothetical protein
MKVRLGDIIGGCFMSGWILVLLLFALNGLLGLMTGEIYLPNKKGGGGTLHGATARIVSLIILVISASILLALWRARKRPRVVHPMDLEIDRELERMRERKRRQAGQKTDVTQDVDRAAGDESGES